MSEPRLSPATRALLRAARADAPSAAARAKVWSTVASAAGGAAGACAAGAAGTASTPPGVLATGAASASKMIALGTLLGGTVTVGLATLLLRLGAVPDNVPPSPPAVAVFAAAGGATGVRTTVPATRVEPAAAPVVDLAADPFPEGTAVLPGWAPSTHPGLVSWSPPVLLPSTATPAVAVATAAHGAASSRAPDDALAQEASLVARAHAALVGGDPHAALRAVAAARRLPSHVLGPEELSIEAQALRALGRDDQAKDVDSTLKRRFPESALAR